MARTRQAVTRGIVRAVEIAAAPTAVKVRRPAPRLAQIDPRLDALRMHNEAVYGTLQMHPRSYRRGKAR